MNEQRFQAVVDQYAAYVFTICYQMVCDYHEAQNLAQDTFLSAYTHLDQCPEAALKPWLARIAANKARDYLKSAYRRRVLVEGEPSAVRAAGGPTPETLALTREGVWEIRGLIAGLREPYRLVATLYFLEERSTAEIAELTGRPPKTVQTQLRRARGILQKRVRKGEEP